jgi:hypothetical protein
VSRARCSAPIPCSGCEAKDLLRCSSGQPITQAVLDSPTVQRSRSFGFAETLSKHFAVRVARLRMACRGSEMDRYCDVCSGFSNSGNGSKRAGKSCACSLVRKIRRPYLPLRPLAYFQSCCVPVRVEQAFQGPPSKPDLGLLGAEACGKAGEEIGFSR